MLILGGARSGKSACALRYATACFQFPVLLATAEALDNEMRVRIDRHIAERPPHWNCIEEPVDLAAAYRRVPETCDGIVVDCLTVWASNVLVREGEDAGKRRIQEFLALALPAQRPIIFVSNEVGLGIVPATPLGREFRDESGRMNQDIAARVDDVLFVVSGLELVLKGGREEWTP